MDAWTCALMLDEAREAVAGSGEALVAAISCGADLRIGTAFRHNEHIDTASDNAELIEEFAEFGVTYTIEGRWAAGIMSLRQPVDLPAGFGARPSMSFFLYNQDGTQAIARPHLGDAVRSEEQLPPTSAPPPDMPRYHMLDCWDAGTNAPSHNFVYDFDHYRFMVRDDWREVAEDQLAEAFRAGCAIKIGVSGLCESLAPPGETAPRHEVFVQTGSAYYYTEQRLLMVGSHPLVRVSPAIPMRYSGGAWDFGWLFARSDGHVVYRRCDPYTLRFSDWPMRCEVRWFVR